MIVKKQGGMTEFIPSPLEKREGLIRDHVLALLENVHQRLTLLEQATGMPLDKAQSFLEVLQHMKSEESRNLKLHRCFTTTTSENDR